MLRTVLISTVVLFLSSCMSIYVYPNLDDVSRKEAVASGLTRLVLGVERKNAEVDYRGLPPQTGVPYDLQTLIDALNEYQVFKRTAFLDQLDIKPDLILTSYRAAQPGFRGIHGEHGGLLCIGYYYPISLLTLTVLPIYCSSEEKVSFTLSRPGDTARSSFQFPRYSKQILGVWAPVVATINPGWQSTSTRDDSEKSKETKAVLTKRYKRFIVQKFREFEPRITEVLAEGK